jgi:hypothetical protein
VERDLITRAGEENIEYPGVGLEAASRIHTPAGEATIAQLSL